MEALTTLLDFILHINDHLDALVLNYGTAIYGIPSDAGRMLHPVGVGEQARLAGRDGACRSRVNRDG
jgi:hypothetical protein